MTALELVLLLLGGAAGAAVARTLRLPMWPVTGSIGGAAVVHALAGGSVVLPAWWAMTGQALVGIAVGSAISSDVLREFRAVLLPGSVAVVTIVALGLAAGIAISLTGLIGREESLLGMVPGGVGEMVAAATALDADSAVVAGMHVARLLVVVSTIPLLVRWARRWTPPAGAGRPPG